MSSDDRDTRRRILDACWRLLEERGAGDVRMSDIARAAGISRQAVYLHFPSRTELLIATTRHVDEVKDVDARLAGSRAATTGVERLGAFVEAWGNYIPEIHGVSRALTAVADTDEAARAAWDDRMAAVREGCAAVVAALKKDGVLTTDLTSRQATDVLWTLLSVPSWERLIRECGWSQKTYVEKITTLATRMLIA